MPQADVVTLRLHRPWKKELDRLAEVTQRGGSYLAARTLDCLEPKAQDKIRLRSNRIFAKTLLKLRSY